MKRKGPWRRGVQRDLEQVKSERLSACTKLLDFAESINAGLRAVLEAMARGEPTDVVALLQDTRRVDEHVAELRAALGTKAR